MSRRNQLKQEAAQMRRRIDHHAYLVYQRIDSFIRLVRFLVGSPASLPLAFVAGILADRLRVPGIKCVYGLLADLAGQVKAMRTDSSDVGA